MGVKAWCENDRYVYQWYAWRCGTNNDKIMVNFSVLFTDIRDIMYSFRFPKLFRIRILIEIKRSLVEI